MPSLSFRESQISAFSTLSHDPLLNKNTANLQLSLTEVRIKEGEEAETVMFAEFYNSGEGLDFSLTDHRLLWSGLVSYVPTSGKWAIHTYLVLYNSDRKTPECRECSCERDPSNGEWCSLNNTQDSRATNGGTR